MKRLRSLPSAITVGLLALAGCGQSVGVGASGSSSEPVLPKVADVHSYDDFELPLQKYRISPDEMSTIVKASMLLEKKCASRFGVTVPQQEIIPMPAVDRLIGVVSASDAASYGYRNHVMDAYAAKVDKVKEQQSVDPEVVRVLTGKGQTVVNGVELPEGGCYGEARRALSLDAGGVNNQEGENFVIGLAARATDASKADSRVKTVFAKWRDCMNGAGYSYLDPMAANDDPTWAVDEVTPAEIKTATTDVTCREENDVNTVWVAAITAYQHLAIVDNHDKLDAFRALVDARVTRAHDVLAGK